MPVRREILFFKCTPVIFEPLSLIYVHGSQVLPGLWLYSACSPRRHPAAPTATAPASYFLPLLFVASVTSLLRLRTRISAVGEGLSPTGLSRGKGLVRCFSTRLTAFLMLIYPPSMGDHLPSSPLPPPPPQ